MENRRMLTVKQVAQELQIGQVTVLRWLRSGKLAGVKPGGTRIGWRIPASEVERLERGDPSPIPENARRQATLRALRDQAERARARGDDEGAARFEAMAAELAID
jgi:excisionase family DNA binding protein